MAPNQWGLGGGGGWWTSANHHYEGLRSNVISITMVHFPEKSLHTSTVPRIAAFNIIIHNVLFSVANPTSVLCATEKTSQAAITATTRPDVMTTVATTKMATTKMGASSDGAQIRMGEVNDNIPLNGQSDDDSPFNTGWLMSRS